MATTLTTTEASYLSGLLCKYIEALPISIYELNKLHFGISSGAVTTLDANDSSFFALLIRETDVADASNDRFANNLIAKLKEAN